MPIEENGFGNGRIVKETGEEQGKSGNYEDDKKDQKRSIV